MKEREYEVATDADCDFDDDIELPLFPNHPPRCGDGSDRIPDVYAEKEDEDPVIVEIETGEIDTENVKCQLKTFVNNEYTIVCVSEEKKQKMERLLDSWKIFEVEVHTYRL